MKVVFASSEVVPFASTGGLGDVANSLPVALRRLGVDIWRVMPMYRHVMEGGFQIRDTGLRLKIPLGFRIVPSEIWISEGNDPVTYFVRRDEYFDRRELYTLPERDYADNFERFTFFQKAVVALIDALGYNPDIVHGNDWSSGLIPMFLKHGINGMGRNGTEKTVCTIHNLAYQGIYPGGDFPLTNLPFSCFSINTMEFYGNINCLKAGLMSSDMVTTVSRSYAKEIRTKDLGCGLDGVLINLGERLRGIENGVDYEVWNPARDALIKAPYTAEDLSGKERCKRALLARAGFAREPDMPVVGIISRLVAQKGMDLLTEAMPELMKMDLRFVLLGSGQEQYQALCEDWARQWPDRFHATLGFDHKLAHRIESGADIFLMPSRFEPCGLSQLYALRYGTVPVVHATGGLNDTISELSADGGTGNGFRFETYHRQGLIDALQRAIDMYRQPEVWKAVARRVMREDFSWSRSATEYAGIYDDLIRR